MSVDAESIPSTNLKIIDNNQKGECLGDYLRSWFQDTRVLDVATAHFDIGALLALEGDWQDLDEIRILMGDEISYKTRNALLQGVQEILDTSIEKFKQKEDFLPGVAGIQKAIQQGKIKARIYNKEKFHAKLYISHGRDNLFATSAIVGSSNFTRLGLQQNIELNIYIEAEVQKLQDWYDKYWEQAEEIDGDIAEVIERHTREYTPFEVYAKALYEFFKNHEMSIGEWEEQESKIFPKLAQYQREGYQALMKIAHRFNGGFLCDGVGLGKTFIGLMLIERLVVFENLNVVLIVPKSIRDTWEYELKKHIPEVYNTNPFGFTNIVILNHTDIGLEKNIEVFESIKNQADVILIDEAHAFRNPGKKGSRYRQLKEVTVNKQVFLMTATPVNNSLRDFQHQIELFSQEDNYFGSTLGIHSLKRYISQLEKQIDIAMQADGHSSRELFTDQAEVDRKLREKNDQLFSSLVVQRSRRYVRESELQNASGLELVFPERQLPQVVEYSLENTYGALLRELEDAFDKEDPLFTLPMYYPLHYYLGDRDREEQEFSFDENRQKQVVALIRTQFLKRFESSVQSFEVSCIRLFKKIWIFVQHYSVDNERKEKLAEFESTFAPIFEYISPYADPDDEDAIQEDSFIPELSEAASDLNPDEYDLGAMIDDSYIDLEQLAIFIEHLKDFDYRQDSKLNALLELLQNHPQLNDNKVIIFTEYQTTAQYLEQHLKDAGITGVDEVDGSSTRKRYDIVKQFAPYYNGSSVAELEQTGLKETRVLISTDVLAEGLNLQDATFLMNYDIHWNPVRLMQRIGRIDRRLSAETEARIISLHPERETVRKSVSYWNFLPPQELDRVLQLYNRVSNKTLRISKILGIEEGKFLRPDDDYDERRDINADTTYYDGEITRTQEMRLTLDKFMNQDSTLRETLENFPLKVFSGKELEHEGENGVFFCYSLPGKVMGGDDDGQWNEASGRTQWYFYHHATETISEDPNTIDTLIKSDETTQRVVNQSTESLSEIRRKIEKHIRNTYLKKLQAPIEAKAVLKTWMSVA